MTSSAESAGRVCAAFVAQAPVEGAAFTLMNSDALRETLCASDEVIAAVEDLQFSVGEGPSLEAFTTCRPVLVSDLSSLGAAARWPVFATGVARLPVGGLFAFPLQIGALTMGVCAAYRSQARQLTSEELAVLFRAIDAATMMLLMVRAGESDVDLDNSALEGRGGRRQVVHQATGMLTVQLEVDSEEALARLRAHAFGNGTSMDDIAADIVARRLRLEPDRDAR